MSTIDPSQLSAADMSNPALSAQDLADIVAVRPDLRPYVAAHPSLYPALGEWLAAQGVVAAQPPSSLDSTDFALGEPTQVPGLETDTSHAHEATANTEGETELPHDAPGDPTAGDGAFDAPASLIEEEPATSEDETLTELAASNAEAQPEPMTIQDQALTTGLDEATVKAGHDHSMQGTPTPSAPALNLSDEDLERDIIEGTRERSMMEIIAEENAAAQAKAGQTPQGYTPGQEGYTPGQAPQGYAPAGQAPQGYAAPGAPAPSAQGPHMQPGLGNPAMPAGQQFASPAFNQGQAPMNKAGGAQPNLPGRVKLSLIGVLAASGLIFLSMLLPFSSLLGHSVSAFGLGAGVAIVHLMSLMAAVGLAITYWFTNQKWAYLGTAISSFVVALFSIVQFMRATSSYLDASIGAYLMLLFSLVLAAGGVMLLIDLKQVSAGPVTATNATGAAFNGMNPQQAQYGAQASGLQAPGQAPQGGHGQPGQYGPQGQFGQQAPFGGQGQAGGFQVPQAPGQVPQGQGQFGQQGGAQSNKPYNPFSPQG